MGKKSALVLVAAVALAAAPVAKAVGPALQLDIVGGSYEQVGESIVIGEDTFQLAAIIDPSQGSAPDENDTFYIAVSLVPRTTTAFDGGSFTFNGQTVNVTADMVSGTPNGLPSHGQFANFYIEFDFTFDLSDAGKVLEYNAQDNPGGPTFDTSGTAFAVLFDVDKSGLGEGVELHFDLYNKDGNEIVVDKFAPFSHDAETIPEPTGFILTAAGLGLFGLIRRRRA